MAQRKTRNKMPLEQVVKVRARYKKMYEEFSALSVEELIEKSKSKMSFTDKRALIHAYNEKKPIETSKPEEKDGNAD